MKKILSILLFFGLCLQIAYSQPTAEFAVENPRIIGNDFYFDIYLKRTNDVPDWYEAGSDSAMWGNGSWVFAFSPINLDLAGAAVTYTNPILFPATSGYSFSFYNYGFNFEVNCAKPGTVPAALRREMILNKWYHAVSVKMPILVSSSTSNLVWAGGGLAFTTITNSSNFPDALYDSDRNMALDHKCWTGAINSDWDDAGNWSPAGVPTLSDDIIYPNVPANEMTICNVGDYGIVNNLRVNHLATLLVPPNKGITVTGNIDLKGGTNIILAAGTGAGTLSSALIPEGTITNNSYIEDGHIEVHRTLYYGITTAGFYQHQVAAPVNGVILDDWDMIHEYSYAFEFQNDNQAWWNIYDPTRSTPVGYGFVLSLYEQAGPSTEDVIFTDGLELGAVSRTINIDAGEVSLIGNPYTAPIDWDVVYAANTNLNGTNRVWDPTGSYVEYVQGTGGNDGARYVQPGQSFFIEALGGSIASFNIPTNSRTQNIRAYLKDDEEFPNLLRIYTEGSTTVDEQYIRFKEGEGVTGGFDEMHDALYWPSNYGDTATQIYTIGTDASHLAVDARPMIEDEQIDIPLHFKAEREDTYGIFADEESVQSFAPSIKIFLEDTFFPSQQWTDLKEGGYTFTASPEDDYNRFILHFYDSEFGVEELGYQPIKIYSDRSDAIVVNESEQLIKEIHVYDITGNLMLSKSQVNATITRMHISDNTGYYVVKVITDKAVYSEKVLITK